MDILEKEEGMRKSLIIGFLAFFIALIFSKNTFAEENNIYISRVYATDSKEFVELFNSGKDYKFKEISLKNNQKQIEIAKIQNGIFKSQKYMTFAQNAQNSDVKFKEEFRNIDTIGQQPILGLYIDGELKDYICSDEKRCIKGLIKNSTDLKPSNKGVEKIAVSKEEILKNGETMKPSEIKKGYDFGLRNFNDYVPKTGGLVLNDKKKEIDNNSEKNIEKPIENINGGSSGLENAGDILEKPEVSTSENKKDESLNKLEANNIGENNNLKPTLSLVDENKVNDKKQDLTEKNKNSYSKDIFSKSKTNFEEKNNKTTIQSKNKTKILAPNTGFNQKNANFTLQILLLYIFEILTIFKRRVVNEIF